MVDDEREALFRSMVDERVLLLGRLKAYMDVFEKVRVVADVAITKPGGNEALIKIRDLAEGALAL